MFKKILIPFILILSFSINGQKKELKEVDKLLKTEDYDTALNQLLSIEPIIENSELKYKAQYQFLAGKIYGGQKDFKAAFTAFDLARQIEVDNGSSKYTVEIDKLINNLINEAIDKANGERENGNYNVATDILISIYNIDKNKYVDYLFLAATYAVNSMDYEQALVYYKELRDLNYTGSVEKFYATENETGQEVELSAEEYVFLQKLKSHSNFRTEITESRLPEITKNIAFIYFNQNRNDLALDAIKDARAANPLDINLILVEADLYLKLGDNQKYLVLIDEAIEKEPDNHILYFNKGVITAEEGDKAKARSFYERAIDLNPSHADSYINLAALILDPEQDLIDKMDSIVRSNKESDVVKYKKYKKQREDLYVEVIPLLENFYEIDSTNTQVLKKLKEVYYTLGDYVKYNAYKEKVEALGQ